MAKTTTYAKIAGTTLTTEIYEPSVEYNRSVDEAIRLCQYIYKYYESKKTKSMEAYFGCFHSKIEANGWIIPTNCYNKYGDKIYYMWNGNTICFFSFEGCGIIFRIYDATKSKKLVDGNYGFVYNCEEFNEVLQKYNLGKCYKI